MTSLTSLKQKKTLGLKTLRAIIKLLAFTVFTLLIVILQTPLMAFSKGRIAYIIPRFCEAGASYIFGIKVRVKGAPVEDRQVIYVGNHLSYLDILSVGQFLKGSFVARGDLSGWPIFGFLARLQQTIFISRNRKDALKGRAALERVLSAGKNIIIFAEGTSTNGETVQPFKSSLFGLAMDNPTGKAIPIQPFTIDLTSVDGHPVEQNADLRDLYAWHGDMTMLPHIWAFAGLSGVTIDLTFHPPIETHKYTDRKKLCLNCYNDVKNGLRHPAEDIEKEPEQTK